jgi:hypothetical protein
MSDESRHSLPPSWVWRRIQDVATTATGGTPSRTVSSYFAGQFRGSSPENLVTVACSRQMRR